MTTNKKTPTHFVKLSPSQILSEFPSKMKKDANGNPVNLSRVLLPSKEFSSNPIGDYATIVVPSWTIMDDKFYKETDHKKYKILGINLEKSYEVQYSTSEMDPNGYPIKEKVIVSGDRLVEAFLKHEKQKKMNEKAIQDESKNKAKNKADEDINADMNKSKKSKER